jgi:hypothetical protein
MVFMQIFKLYILVLAFSFLSSTAQALVCTELFPEISDEIQIERNLESIQDEVSRLNQELVSSYGSDTDINIFLTLLLERLNEVDSQHGDLLLRFLEWFEGQDPVTLDETSILISELNQIRQDWSQGPQVELASTNPRRDFNYVIDHPSEVIAEHVYTLPTVNGNNGGEVHFRFSERLVTEVFRSPNQSLIQQLTRSLRLIDRGVHGQRFEGVGIKSLLDMHKSFIEIRTRGNNANFRIYGYVHGGIIYFETWSKSSDHDNRHLVRAFRPVYQLMQSRGHNE